MGVLTTCKDIVSLIDFVFPSQSRIIIEYWELTIDDMPEYCFVYLVLYFQSLLTWKQYFLSRPMKMVRQKSQCVIAHEKFIKVPYNKVSSHAIFLKNLSKIFYCKNWHYYCFLELKLKLSLLWCFINFPIITLFCKGTNSIKITWNKNWFDK